MNQKQAVTAIMVALFVAALFWFNRYSYSEMKIEDLVVPVRTSRINGESEIFVMGQWKQMDGNPTQSISGQAEQAVSLPPNELAKLQGQASSLILLL